MPKVPGTNIQAVFYAFTGNNPNLYYSAQGGKLNLASVNAGNSDGLCVGLGGVNGGFFTLLSATQKRANLTPQQDCTQGNYDDYQDRHLKLLAKADTGGTAWDSYSNTDPCAFSFVNPSRLNPANAGWYEGVCFVDVFDANLCPHGNPRNFAMLYAAPPYDGNYASQATFLAAIENMAGNIIKTVSAYNAEAAKQNLPALEVLRNTLFSSNIYNRTLQVPKDDIARAIFKGFAAGLASDPNSGLIELEFPVGDLTRNQDPLFAIVEQDLAKTSPGPVFVAIRGGAGPVVVDANPDDDNDEIGSADPSVSESDTDGEDPQKIVVAKQSLIQAAQALENATQALDSVLKGNPTFSQGNFQGVVQGPNGDYISTSAALASGVDYEMLPANADQLNSGIQDTPAQNAGRAVAQSAENILSAKSAVINARTLAEARTAADNARTEAQTAENAAANADAEAKKPGATARDRNVANAAQELARTCRNLAGQLDAAVRAREAVARCCCWDVNGKLSVGRLVAAIAIPAVTALGVLGGVLGYLFGRGGDDSGTDGNNGRVPDVPPSNQDLSVAWLDDGTSVDIDVPAQNQALNSKFDPAVVQAVHLSANGQNTDQIGTPGQTDVWTSANKHITFQPSKSPSSGSEVKVNYVLDYTGMSSSSGPKQITITFVEKAITLAQKALADSKGILSASFPLSLPDQFVFKPSSMGWMIDSTQKVLTYQLPAGASSAIVVENYSLGAGLTSNTAKVVVLVDLDTMSGTPFPMLPNPGLDTSWTVLDQKGSPAQSVTVAGGVWSIVNSVISFIPAATNPPAANASLSVGYGLVVNGKVAAQATAKMQFNGATGPTTVNISSVAPNRTDKTFPVIIPAGLSNLRFANAATTEGNWAVSGNQIQFTPVSIQHSAQNTYTADGGVSGTITLTFPVDIALDTCSRQASTLIDLKSYNPKITSNFTIAVQDTTPPADTSNAAWSDGTSQIMPRPGVLFFTPPSDRDSKNVQGTVLRIDSLSKLYVLTFADGTKTTAKVTLNFTTALTAYNFTYAALQTETGITLTPLNHCYIPASPGFRELKIGDRTSPMQTTPGATWTATGMGPNSVISVSIDDVSKAPFTLPYTIVDLSNATVSGVITVTESAMMRARAADYLLAKDIWTPSPNQQGPAQLAVDVLSNCTSFYDKDPSSVILTGLMDVGQDFSAASAAIQQKDGKAIRIPDEGMWFVDDSGKIAFQAVKGLTHAPTPVIYRFRDTKGILSNQAVIVVDPVLTHATSLPQEIRKMTDKAFWDSFQTHVSRWHPTVTHDEFITVCTLFASAVKTLGNVGRDPVSGDEFEKLYRQWFTDARHWDDPAGTANPVGLVSICANLVKQNTQGTKLKYRPRYWQLMLMARMAAYSPMLTLSLH